MLYLKLAPRSCFDKSSRDKRELACAQDLGYQVMVISNDLSMPLEAAARKYSFKSSGFCQYKGSSSNIFARFKKIASDVSMYKKMVVEENPSVISCHNLYPLLIGYLASKEMRVKPKIVYDAHEFELGLARYQNQPMLHSAGKWLEGYLLRRCDLTILINEGVKEAMMAEHGFAFNNVVVRSTPMSFPENDERVNENRKMVEDLFCSKGCNPDNNSFIAMYQGYIQENRGIENLLGATAQLPWLKTIILGDVNPHAADYLERIKNTVRELNIEERVLFLPAVPHTELWKYTPVADVGIVAHQPVVKNYIYSLPNKFFENIQALTPVVCTDVPELARLVNQYHIGLLVPAGEDPTSWAIAIEKMRNDKEEYTRYKENLRLAKRDLCWENESKKLIKALKGLF